METLDPRTGTNSIESLRDVDIVYIEVLFHSDLRRIGSRCVLGTRRAAAARGQVMVGRDDPEFFSERDAAPRPLADPCISRAQFALRWSAETERFAVEVAEGARRSVHLHRVDGRPFDGRKDDVPADTLVAVGDRALLLLGCGPIPARSDESELIGGSNAITALHRTIATLADSQETVLVHGETGVGKELVARAIHARGPRQSKPFVAVNCAALPEHLVESELFGHVRGSFSGASAGSAGLFRAAAGGTLFLDEIAELSPPAQSKLLRVLQEKAVRPIGETREIPVDARVIAATHRDLSAQVAAGSFRADLFARLEAPTVTVPPLRDRRRDVPRLFFTFLRRLTTEAAAAASTGAEALARLWRDADGRPPPVPIDFVFTLLAHAWPRNVREVEKLAASVAALTRDRGAFAAPALVGPPVVPGEGAVERAPASSRGRSRPERGELQRHLDAHDYVQSGVAKALGISRVTLDRWMRELAIRRPKELPSEEIVAACRRARGDHGVAARELGVSLRGFKLRVTELGIGALLDSRAGGLDED